jgi:signal transduction histidine kinase
MPVQQAVDILGHSDAYVGGRWHTAIFALRGGAPVVPFSAKQSKMQGLIGRLKNLGEKELLCRQRFDLLAMARETSQLVGGAVVEVRGESAVITGDADELQKVLLNFLINAVEASPAGVAVQVEVGIAPTPFFRVIDHGYGMSIEFQRRELFKPFVTTKKKGMGIGLYQCRRIVEAHGGHIEVLSIEGHGSVFTARLPGSPGDAAQTTDVTGNG